MELKCICGHECIDQYYGNDEEKFIRINVVATRVKTGYNGYDYNDEVDIYACPKCGTLKIDLW